MGGRGAYVRSATHTLARTEQFNKEIGPATAAPAPSRGTRGWPPLTLSGKELTPNPPPRSRQEGPGSKTRAPRTSGRAIGGGPGGSKSGRARSRAGAAPRARDGG